MPRDVLVKGKEGQPGKLKIQRELSTPYKEQQRSDFKRKE
jgi:hypothetical protein